MSARAVAEISFLGTGDGGPVHGPKDGYPIERHTEIVRPTLAAVDLRLTKLFPSPSWTRGAVRNHTGSGPELSAATVRWRAKRSLLAKAIFTRSGVKRVSFLPMIIDRRYRPEGRRRGDPRFDDMVRYMALVWEGFERTFAVEAAGSCAPRGPR